MNSTDDPDSTTPEENLGRLDDEQEAAETSSDAPDGAAARGEDDATEGSPHGTHPVGESYPDEAVRFDELERGRSDAVE